MAQTVYLRAQGGSLHPISSMDLEAIEGLEPRAEYRAELTRPRSLPRHRYYWGILSEVLRSTHLADTFPNTDKLHKGLLLALGHVTTVITPDGEVGFVVDSTAFNPDGMEEDEFRPYLDRALGKLSEWTGVDVTTLRGMGDE